MHEHRQPSPPTARVARTVEEVEALRPVWDELGVGYVDAEHDPFLALLRLRPGVLRPHVVVLERGDEPQALAVGRIERAPFAARFGYRKVYSPVLRTLVVTHGGVSGADDDGTARAVVATLEDALRENEADALIVRAVRVGSALHRALQEPRSALTAQPVPEPFTHRRLVLPATIDDFYAARDRKSRYNLKRPATLLAKAFDDEFAVEVLRRPEDHGRIFRDLEQIAAKTYQRGLGAGFADTPERREHVRIALERGWFRAWVLTIRGRAVAFWQGNVLGDTLFVSSTGYDPEYAEYGVGTYLQMEMFSDMCEDPDVANVDFGWGDAEYKSRFGNESWEEQDVTLLARTFRGVRVAVARGAVAAADRGARRILAATGGTARVKKLWRARLRRAPG